MYEINSEMCLLEDFNGPVIQIDEVHREKRSACHIWVTETVAMDRAHIDHFIQELHCSYGANKHHIEPSIGKHANTYRPSIGKGMFVCTHGN